MKTIIRSYLIWSMLIGGALGYVWNRHYNYGLFNSSACYLVGLAIGLVVGLLIDSAAQIRKIKRRDGASAIKTTDTLLPCKTATNNPH